MLAAPFEVLVSRIFLNYVSLFLVGDYQPWYGGDPALRGLRVRGVHQRARGSAPHLPPCQGLRYCACARDHVMSTELSTTSTASSRTEILRMLHRSRDEHGAQHHIYRLVKDWALRRRQRSRDHHAKWRGVRAHVNFCRADSFNDTNDEQLTTKCVDESNRTKNA